jgi:peptidoglycan-associated lipoprotein
MRNGLSNSLSIASLVAGLGLAACSASQKAAPPPEPGAGIPPQANAAPAVHDTNATPSDPSAMNASRSAELTTDDDAALSFDPLYFAFNSDELLPEARQSLDSLAAYLSKHAGASVTISGHCDERGTAEYNLALGERRAAAARTYLSRLGVDPSRVKLISYGSERPALVGDGENVWAKNRRDEFQVAGTGKTTAPTSMNE